MCAIVGVADLRGGTRAGADLVAAMSETLAHRGPDGSCVAEMGAADSPHLTFGFRRLAILDLGSGARDYADESGRLRAICNGEIYNAPEIRRDLLARGHRLETLCDTEVIPHLYEDHGLDFVSRLNGMFAFAVFDGVERRLVLGRDRAGEKPLYYVERGGTLLFASEIKALLAHPDVGLDLDPGALARYLLYGYVPAPRTPFRGIRKLPAGHLLIAEDGRVRLERYWDIRRHLRGAAAGPSGEEAAREVLRLLTEAVLLRLRADVPVGIFLSGGVDSSAIAALAVEASGKSLPSFTIGLPDPSLDESGYARRAAAHLGTEHHELLAGPGEMTGALLAMARVMDEPLADASLVPSYLVACLARRRVKVALGGEGGDEIFGGYPTYLGERLASAYARLPRRVRAVLRRGIEALPPTFRQAAPELLLKKFVAAADRPWLERHATWFGYFGPDRLPAILAERALADAGPADGDDALGDARAIVDGIPAGDPLDRLLILDFLMFLQDDLMTKVDRASMAASLEVRAPFLHHPLVEYVTGLPAGLKLRGLTSKYILKRAIGERLTREIITRRKRGFSIPAARLLRGPLEPLLRRALDPARLFREGLLRPAAVTDLMREHFEGRRDNGRTLWCLLMLQLWRSRIFEGGDLLDL